MKRFNTICTLLLFPWLVSATEVVFDKSSFSVIVSSHLLRHQKREYTLIRVSKQNSMHCFDKWQKGGLCLIFGAKNSFSPPKESLKTKFWWTLFREGLPKKGESIVFTQIQKKNWNIRFLTDDWLVGEKCKAVFVFWSQIISSFFPL